METQAVVVEVAVTEIPHLERAGRGLQIKVMLAVMETLMLILMVVVAVAVLDKLVQMPLAQETRPEATEEMGLLLQLQVHQ